LSSSKSKRSVFLLLPTFAPNDAIGNDVLKSYEILRRAGYDAHIFADHVDPSLASLAAETRAAPQQLWKDTAAILIYHHSTDWQAGERILARSKNRTVIKHHNVTPPRYFAGYAENYYRSCISGVEATGRLAKLRIDFVWGDSQFNADEFTRLGVPRERCRVIPPLHRIEDLGRAPLDTIIAGKYRDEGPNLLFVGAFRPNKGHFKAIETFAGYRALAVRPARLFLVGNLDVALTQYREDLIQHARNLEVDDSVHLAHGVSLSQLRAYYNIASVFLCVSEHEGFCVPLAEAMFFRVPIVAWANTAVGETCGGCGIVSEVFDAHTLAEGIDEAVTNRAVMRDLVHRGRRRYETVFHPDVIEAQLLSLIQEVEDL
jgi:glycosyltransferase involved in cell wall biosynthesis